jgi:hypothetical protein
MAGDAVSKDAVSRDAVSRDTVFNMVMFDVNVFIEALVDSPRWRQAPRFRKRNRRICWSSILLTIHVFSTNILAAGRRRKLFSLVEESGERTAVVGVER